MEFKKWECIVCGWVYDEEKGHPEDGLEPGTRWEDVPEDWGLSRMWSRERRF